MRHRRMYPHTKQKNNKMQRTTNANDNELDLLSNLPLELILKIFKNIDNKDVNSLKLISKKFHEIIHEYFLNSLYGRSLRFIKWEDEQIKKFEEDVKQFTKEYTVGLFNRPDLSNTLPLIINTRWFNRQYQIPTDKIIHYFQLSIATVFSLASVYLIYKLFFPNDHDFQAIAKTIDELNHVIADLEAKYGYNDEIKDKKLDRFIQNMNLSRAKRSMDLYWLFTLFFALVCSVVAIPSAYSIYDQIRHNRGLYNSSTITAQDIALITSLLDSNRLLIADNFIAQLQIGVTTKSQLVPFLQKIIKDVHSNANELNSYLLNQRFSGRKVFNEKRDGANLNAIKPNLGKYAKNMLGFWMRTTEKIEKMKQDQKDKQNEKLHNPGWVGKRKKRPKN